MKRLHDEFSKFIQDAYGSRCAGKDNPVTLPTRTMLQLRKSFSVGVAVGATIVSEFINERKGAIVLGSKMINLLNELTEEMNRIMSEESEVGDGWTQKRECWPSYPIGTMAKGPAEDEGCYIKAVKMNIGSPDCATQDLSPSAGKWFKIDAEGCISWTPLTFPPNCHLIKLP